MIYLGIDNGISGGLAFFNPSTLELNIYPMPVVAVKSAKGNKNEYNIPEIISIIKKYPQIGLAVLEKAQAYPGQGSVSNFTVGRCFGLMEGILASLGIPYVVVHPKTWQKKAFEGLAHQDTKQASILVAQRLFPQTSFVATERSKKPHDGLTDAALMAYHASRM